MANPDPNRFSKRKVTSAGAWLRENIEIGVDREYFIADNAAILLDDDYEVRRRWIESWEESIAIVDHWRATHQAALTSATMGLRSMVRTAGCVDASVSQRLKRMPTIIDKLRRYPKMELARMYDLGGCRAVLADVGQVRRVQRRIEGNGKQNDAWTKDYIASPKDSGYRGVHLIVKYRGRWVEVQLRTALQHEWAVTVERMGSRLGADIKSGEGPSEVRDLLSAIGDAIALEDAGEEVDTALRATIEELRARASHHLIGPSSS